MSFSRWGKNNNSKDGSGVIQGNTCIFKINVDVAYYSISTYLVTYVAIRDARGSFLATTAWLLTNALNSGIVEAFFARIKFILFADLIGYNGEWWVSLKACRLSHWTSRILRIHDPVLSINIVECSIVANQFDEQKIFQHYSGEANHVAHDLVMHANESKSLCLEGDPLDFLLNFL